MSNQFDDQVKEVSRYKSDAKLQCLNMAAQSRVITKFDTLYDLPLLVKHGHSAFNIRLQNPRARRFQPVMLPIPFNLLPTQTNILIIKKIMNKNKF